MSRAHTPADPVGMTPGGQRALVWAALCALGFHALGWGLWRQHAGRGEDVRGPAAHLSFRTVSKVLAAEPPQPSPEPVAARQRDVASAAPRPVGAQAPLQPSPAAAQPAADGPVMVMSDMETALHAVSAQAEAAAGNARDPFAIHPDAYLPADALDTQPQLAGPWQLNESAVPPRTPGAPTAITIALRLWVSADGHIDAVQVLSAEPEVPWLDGLLQDIAKTPLRPAYEQGRAVASSWLVEWQLDLASGL